MAGAGNIQIKILGDSSNLSKSLKEANSSLGGLNVGLGKLGKLTALAGAAMAGFAVVGIGASVKAAIDFEKEMRNVNSIAKLGDKQFDALGKSVTGMAQEVGQKPKVLAQGLYDIVSSGFKASDAVKILKVSAIAATAGMTGAATSTKAVTAALNAYHRPAEDARKVSDILFQTVNKGVLTFDELSQNMGDLVPASAPLGVSLEEVGAAMATITLQGVPAAEAATRVKNTMLQLASPSEALKGLLQKQGFASGEAAIKAKGFAGVLTMLQGETKGSVTETAKLTPEIRALLGVVGLTGENLKTYEANLKSMTDAQKGAGITAEVYAEQSKSVAVMWDKVSAGIDVLKIQVGQALLPALKTGIEAFGGFLAKFNEADGASAKFKVAASTIKDAAVLAGTELVRAFKAVDWRAIGDDLVTKWKVAYAGLLTAIKGVDWRGLGKTVGDSLVTALQAVPPALSRVNWNAVGVSLAQGTGRAIKAIGTFLAGVDWMALFGSLLKGELAVAKAYYSVLLGAFKTAGTAITKGLLAGAQAAWGAVSSWLGGVPNMIQNYFVGAGSWLLGAGKALVQGFANGIRSMIGSAASAAADAANAAKNAAMHALHIGSPSRVFHEIGMQTMEGFKQGIEKGGAGVVAEMGAQARKLVAEVGRMQRGLDAINARREREDLASAVRNAQATLTALRNDKKAKQSEITAAQQAVDRAVEDIRIAARQRELTATQAHLTKVQTQFEKAQTAMKESQAKALAAMQATLDKARDRAGNSMGRLADLIQRGFDAVNDAWVSPAQAAINGITDRRATEDLSEAVKDARDRLDEAMMGDDPEAITDARRALARAEEDIVVASLQKQATAQESAHQKAMSAMQDRLKQTIALTGGNMQKILDVIRKYDGGFKEAGDLLGSAFAKALKAAMDQAVDDANAVKALTVTPATKAAAAATQKALISAGIGPSLGVPALGFNAGSAASLQTASGGGGNVTLPIHIAGEHVATVIFDPLRRQAQVYERQNGRPAFGSGF